MEAYNVGSGHQRWRRLGCLTAPGAACVVLLVASLAVGTGAAKTCPRFAKSIPEPRNRQSPFDELSVAELKAIEAYLYSVPEYGLTPAVDTVDGLSRNSIYTIELLPPPKRDALAYLDHGGPLPERLARATMFLNTQKRVTTVIVPAHAPSSHRELHASTEPLWLSRLILDDEYTAIYAVIDTATAKLDPLIRESFGGWSFGPNCGKRCLDVQNTAPSGFVPGERQTWFWSVMDIEGLYLNTVSLEFLVDHADVEDIRIVRVYYGGAVYDSVEELLGKYNDPGSGIRRVRMAPADDPLNQKGPLFSSLRVRMPARNGTELPGPVQFEPQGRRFRVRGHRVSWLDWKFDVGMRVTAGIRLWDVRFKGERIAYEISLQEAAAYYGGWTPSQARTAYLDTAFGMGGEFTELIPGTDCPENAVYIDTPLYFRGAFVHRRAICIFEHANGVPLRRHDQEGQNTYGGLADNVLVVRGIASVDNYDYIISMELHLNGVFETHMHATGYVQACTFESPQQDHLFGHKLSRTSGGTIHVHNLLWKVDLDVAGTSNSFSIAQVKARGIYHPYLKRNWQQVYVDRKFAETEADARITLSISEPKFLSVVNEDKTNKWGDLRGFEIKLHSPVSQVLPLSDPVFNMATWMKNHLYVAKRKESELEGSSAFQQQSTYDPPIDFEAQISNGDRIRGEDLVVWITSGNWHLPMAEDSPTTTAAGARSTWVLRPANFLDEDGATDVAQIRLLSADAAGNAVEENPLYVDVAGVADGCERPTEKVDITLWK